MTRWGFDGVRDRTAVAGSLWIGVVAATTTVTAMTGDGSVPAATLLLAGSAGGRSGFTRLVGWLVGGSLLGAGVGYAAVTVVAGLPLGTAGGVGLGIALGGGLGVVSNLLATDAGDDEADGTESMTVDMESDDSPSPRPADLFADHPDPTLYVVDRGAGPVVLAANDAFAERFDVPADALAETPLDEALLAGGTSESDDREAVVDAFAGDGPAAVRVTCETTDGERTFRLRTVGDGADGYVLYTPVDAAS